MLRDQVKQLEEKAIEGDYVDENGTTWTRPTGEAYYRVCKLRDAYYAKIRAMLEQAENFDPVCRDQAHDVRWCSHCESMEDGVDQLSMWLLAMMVDHRKPQCGGPVEIRPWRTMEEPMREHRDQMCVGCGAGWTDLIGSVK